MDFGLALPFVVVYPLRFLECDLRIFTQTDYAQWHTDVKMTKPTQDGNPVWVSNQTVKKERLWLNSILSARIDSKSYCATTNKQAFLLGTNQDLSAGPAMLLATIATEKATSKYG